MHRINKPARGFFALGTPLFTIPMVCSGPRLGIASDNSAILWCKVRRPAGGAAERGTTSEMKQTMSKGGGVGFLRWGHFALQDVYLTMASPRQNLLWRPLQHPPQGG